MFPIPNPGRHCHSIIFDLNISHFQGPAAIPDPSPAPQGRAFLFPGQLETKLFGKRYRLHIERVNGKVRPMRMTIKNFNPFWVALLISALTLGPWMARGQKSIGYAKNLAYFHFFSNPTHPSNGGLFSSRKVRTCPSLKTIPKESFNPDAWIPVVSKEKTAFDSQRAFNPAGNLGGFSSPLPLVLRI
jgi:hypothetical protein